VAGSGCAEGLEAEPGVSLKFRKLTHLAADVIGELRQQLSQATRAVVLFDSYYLCPAVTHACGQASFRYVGVAKKNRNFAPDGRPRDRRKLGRYAANVLVADAKACAKRLTPLRLHSIQQLQETLRSQLWNDLIGRLEAGQKTRVAARKIKELMQP